MENETPRTDPPPSRDDRALSSVATELDTIGEILASQAASLSVLREASVEDGKNFRLIHSKLDTLISLLTHPTVGLLPRVERLEAWRGEHEREHAAAE